MMPRTASSPAPATHRVAPAAARTTKVERARTHMRSVPRMPDRAPAFETCCLPHRDELFATALRMTREPADAQDLVQETMMRAFLAWPRFEPGTNCRAWLFRILTNAFINIYRKRRRYQRVATEHRGDMVAAIHGDHIAHSTEDVMVGAMLGDEVAAALDTLDADYRQVVEMADLHGIRYRDIASELGVPVGTVMSRLFRARRRLEQQLASFAAADYGIRRAA